MILSDRALRARLAERDPAKRLVVTPILDEQQIGPAGVDLRLGTRFMVDLRTREPVMDPSSEGRPITTFFDSTYRDIGSRFVLYPGQLVLASTFEYVKIPHDLFGILITRSSWNRMGIALYSIVQPGYVGALTLELSNRSPISSGTSFGGGGLSNETVPSTSADWLSVMEYINAACPRFHCRGASLGDNEGLLNRSRVDMGCMNRNTSAEPVRLAA